MGASLLALATRKWPILFCFLRKVHRTLHKCNTQYNGGPLARPASLRLLTGIE